MSPTSDERDPGVATQRAFYLPRLAEHGDDPRAVGWLRDVDQTIRFDNLTIVAGLEDLSVLDVGCGLGHLYAFLRERGHRGPYLGVDLLPEMIASARELHPEARFEVADARAPDFPHQADAVFANGLLSLSGPEDRDRMIATLFGAARVFAAFNALSTWCPVPPPAPFHHVDPVATLERCRHLTPYLMLRHDYSVQDFTLHLFRGVHTPSCPSCPSCPS